MSEEEDKKKDDETGEHDPEDHIEINPVLREVLSAGQRRMRALSMRKNKSKIKAARKRAANRKASPEKLKARAEKKARNEIKSRLNRSKSYSDMSRAEKITLDKRMQKVPKAKIKTLAKRFLPQVRKAEAERMKRRSRKEETITALDMVIETRYGLGLKEAANLSIYADVPMSPTNLKELMLAFEEDLFEAVETMFDLDEECTDALLEQITEDYIEEM